MSTCRTVPDLIAAFGGTTRMAEAFGVLPSAVSNWKAAGRFPDRLHWRIAQTANARGIPFDPAIFAAAPTGSAAE